MVEKHPNQTKAVDDSANCAKSAAESSPLPMALVAIESPYAGAIEVNEAYARACLADCLARGENPYASHLLFTQPGVLDDLDPAQRALGIEAGLQWASDAGAACVVYRDLGISEGMQRGIDRAFDEGRAVEYRELGKEAVDRIIADVDAKQWAVAESDRLAGIARAMQPMGVKCTSCGSAWDAARLAKEKEKRPALVSCCPERKLAPVFRLSGDAAPVVTDLQIEEWHARPFPWVASPAKEKLPAPAAPLAQDVIDLVEASRCALYSQSHPDALAWLDKCAEAFADRVPSENEPEPAQ